MSFFRITSPTGADTREIVDAGNGIYLGDSHQTVEQGWIGNIHSRFSGKSKPGDLNSKSMMRLIDSNQQTAGVEESLGEVCEAGRVIVQRGQASDADTVVALRPEIINQIENAVDEEFEISIIITTSNTTLSSHIQYFTCLGQEFEILSVPLHSGTYVSGDSLTIRIKSVD